MYIYYATGTRSVSGLCLLRISGLSGNIFDAYLKRYFLENTQCVAYLHHTLPMISSAATSFREWYCSRGDRGNLERSDNRIKEMSGDNESQLPEATGEGQLLIAATASI